MEHVKAADEIVAPEKDGKYVLLSISTTAGFYPEEGFVPVDPHEKVEVQLHKAQRTLDIKIPADWVATVQGPSGRRPINPGKTYEENSLSGKVEIDWGPAAGGGG